MDTSSMSHGSSDTGDDGCSHGTATAARQIAAAEPTNQTNRGSTTLSSPGNIKRAGSVNPPDTPPQPFVGVLAGDSWYTVPDDVHATADQAEAKTTPLTIVFAGDETGRLGKHDRRPASASLFDAVLDAMSSGAIY